jgi:peptide/nickel transport system substrate-binding protein
MFRSLVSRRRFLKSTAAGAALLGTARITPFPVAAAGGDAVFAYPDDPGSFDPTICSGQNCSRATEPLYEGLTRFDASVNVQPCLATSWENPDPQTWVFHLRQGVKFHDGSAMTADDVKYSLDRVLDPKTPGSNRPYYETIQEVQVVDPATVKLVLNRPYTPLLGALASGTGAGIISKAWGEAQAAQGTTDFATAEMGTGPFKLTDYVSGDHFTFTKFADYWDTQPGINTITFKILSETAARVAALQAGTVDYAPLDATSAAQLQGNTNVTVYEIQGFTMPVSIHNLRRKPYDDPRVRQAIAIGVDRQEVIQKVFNGKATLTGPVMTGFADWFIPVDQLPYTVDRAKAKSLLAEAGFPNGFSTKILGLNTAPYADVGVVYQAQLKEIGINADLQQTEFTAWLDKIHKFDYDTHVNGYGFNFDPDAIMGRSFMCGSSGNFPGYCDPKFDDLEKQLVATSDHAQRVKVALQMEQMLLADASFIWWCTAHDFAASSKRLKGFTPSPTGYYREALKAASI